MHSISGGLRREINSDEVMWFEYRRVESGTDVITEEPAGDLCWVCGTSLESWPLRDKMQLLQEMETNSSLHSTFQKVVWMIKKMSTLRA